ncbi:MAG: DUF1015 domain-containing protein [Dehalococcoidia bacterium]|nr:DUF1015 domain-containing protein [Dehalococcoidia bacterium]MDD5494673.1 DUF1015 domain-containing protein [Dehalococcoidia bacterium]
MAEVSEFKGIRYNPEKIPYMAEIICPPYDVISPQEQRALYDRNKYNMVRLEQALEQKGDDAKNNKYTRSKDTFNMWLKEGILVQDTVPNYYVHEHIFEMGESKKRRLGIFACVRLEPWENKVVFPHEFTMSGAKTDRLNLMKTCSAGFSPIFGLYEDPGGKINQMVLTRVKGNPVYSFSFNGDSHRFWAVNEPEFVQRLSYFLIPKPIYIADGHHRYETALAYRDYRKQLNPHGSGSEAYNYVMMELVSFNDPGIVILPIHRMVKGIDAETMKRFKKEISGYFTVIEAPPEIVSLNDNRIGSIKLYGLEKGKVLGLSLLPKIKVNDFLTEKRSDAYGKLDVSIVQHVICEKLLGLPAGDTDKLAYTPSGEAAAKLVDEGQFQFTILLNPLPVKTIKMIADANDRMPRKSTFFYPKLPSGLVIYRLDGEV